MANSTDLELGSDEPTNLDNSAELELQDQAPEESEQTTEEMVTLPDGTQVTKEEALAGYMRNRDYTQKRQAESAELAEIREKLEQLQQPAQTDYDPVEYVERESGIELSDEGKLIVMMMDNLAKQIGQTQERVNPIISERNATVAEETFAKLLASKGIEKDTAIQALRDAKGDRAEAAMALLDRVSPKPPKVESKPASPAGTKPGVEVDVSKMGDEEYKAWMKATLAAYPT